MAVDEITAEGAERAQLGLYLRVNLATVVGASIGLVIVELTLVHTAWLLLDAAAVAGVVVALLVARRWLERGEVDPALTLLAVAYWSVSLVTVAVTPFVLPIIMMVVLLPVLLAIPYLSRRRLLVTSAGAVVVSLVLGLAAIARPVTRVEDMAPAGLEHGIVLVFLPLVTALLLINAWRSHLGLANRATELRRSRARVVQAADRERRRIERDLHDGAQQRLTAIAIRFGLAQRLVLDDPTRAAGLLAELDRELHDTIAELRDLAHGIYPPLLGQRGLTEALAAAARRQPVPTTVRTTGVARYAADVETAVYFSCLEALQNAAKHARAGALTVTVDGGRGLDFTVDDDGVGFDPTVAAGGVGLTHMADRLGAVGGSLTVRSAPGQGTRVHGRIAAPSGPSPESVGA